MQNDYKNIILVPTTEYTNENMSFWNHICAVWLLAQTLVVELQDIKQLVSACIYVL